nr:MAG TPA: zinc-ribbon domain protein [Caudoviricetes sp.]
MKTKCPCCGAINSLDALIANEKASEALATALAFNGELGRALVGYLGLFRPANSSLSFDRVATLLGQLLPCVQAQQIQRDGKTYAAPAEAWIYGINTMLATRHNLKLPMKNHGYLFEIISRWQPAQSAVENTSVLVPAAPAKPSRAISTINAAQQWVDQQ